MKTVHRLIVLALALVSAPALAQVNPGTAQLLTVNGITINPTAGTTNPALTITQTGPSSGAPTGPVLFNSITLTDQGIAPIGAGWDSFGQIQSQVNALRINLAVQGGGATKGALSAAAFITGANGGTYGGAVGVTTNSALSATYMWGLIGYGTIWQTGSAAAVISLEGEVGISTGGSSPYRIGVSSNTQGPIAGTTLDAAFAADTHANALPGTGTTAPFQHLMAVSSNLYGTATSPLATTGDFFFSDASITVAHFANLANVTVTGNILNFPNLAISGAGAAVFGAGVSGLPASGISTTCSSCGSATIFGQINGASNADGIVIKDSSTNNVLFTGVAEASNAVVRFGQTTGNWGELVTLGSSNVGLMMGTLTSEPVIIGTNNTARLALSAASGFLGLQNISPKTYLDLNVNTASSPSLVVATSLARMQAADAAVGGMEWASYGAAAQNVLAGIIAGNTSASPTATPTALNMFNLRGYGYTGSAFAVGGLITIHSTQLWAVGAQGTQIDLYTTPNSTTALAIAMSLYPSGGVGIGTSADPGINNIAAARYFAGSTGGLVSKTCTINTANVTTGITLTITGGIITGTTTC